MSQVSSAVIGCGIGVTGQRKDKYCSNIQIPAKCKVCSPLHVGRTTSSMDKIGFVSFASAPLRTEGSAQLALVTDCIRCGVSGRVNQCI